MPNIDTHDIKMGFWIGAGIFLFTLLIGLASGVLGKVVGRG
jgi:hypothetical protein